MMCLSDRSTSTGAFSDRSTFTSTDERDGSSPLFFLEVSLSSRFFETNRRRCIWRPDRLGADRDLL